MLLDIQSDIEALQNTKKQMEKLLNNDETLEEFLEKAKQITIEHLDCSEEYFESKMSELSCNSVISYYRGALAGLNANAERIAELEEKIKHKNCVDCSNHGKQIEVLKLKAQNEKMKCCGNCKHWIHESIQKYCLLTNPNFLIKRQLDVCNKWELAERQKKEKNE